MKKKNIIQSIISKRQKMNLKDTMFDNHDDTPEQEMTMDEILASIRRFVDPHHEESPKQQTVSQVSVGYTDHLHGSGLHADRIHGYNQTSSDYAILHTRTEKTTSGSPQIDASPQHTKSTTMEQMTMEPQRSAPLKEFLKTPSPSSGTQDLTPYASQDVVRLTPNKEPNIPSHTPVPEHHSTPEPTVQTSASKSEPNTISEENGELISQETQTQVRQSFSKLTETLQKKQPETKNENVGGKITIDDMFRQLAIPMIKSWIDQNMPSMVEKLIEKEIKKITGNE